MSESNREKARRLAAEVLVARAYDIAREGRPFDMTTSRRRRALDRLEAQAREALTDASLDALGTGKPVDVTPDRLELEAALVNLCDRMLSRPTVTDAVVNSLDDTRRTVNAERGAELRRPPRLADWLSEDGERPPLRRPRPAGHGRSRAYR